MAIKIISYPKLRKTSLLSLFLSPEGMRNLKDLLDRSDLGSRTNDAYLLHDDKSFILVILSAMIHDNSQVTIGTYISEDFEPAPETAPLYSDGQTASSLWGGTVSFLTYELFHIRKLQKMVFYAAPNRECLLSVLEQYRFTTDGIMREHLLWGGRYYDAAICTMTRGDFERYSTGAMPILDEYLIVRSTDAAIFAVDVIKRDEPMPSYVEKLIGDAGLQPGRRPAPGEPVVFHDPEAYPYLKKALAELSEYFGGTRKKFDLDLELYEASDFQKAVWAATVKVPYGQTISYEDISRRISGTKHKDNPNILSRAVGTALSRNPVMIVVPCHRIIGKDGKLRGFAGGLDIKDYLLTHELTHY